jgi:hypothetical protein
MWIHLIINYLKLEFIREFKEACPSLPSVSQSPSPCNQSSSHCDQNANRRDLDPCGPEKNDQGRTKWDILIKYWVHGLLETALADVPCFCSVYLLSVFVIVSLF